METNLYQVFHHRVSKAVYVLLPLLICRAAVAADETAESLLKDKGLKKIGTTWVLSEETELTKQMSQTAKMKRQVVDAGKTLLQAERQAALKKQTLAQMKLQHVQLSAQWQRIIGLLDC